MVYCTPLMPCAKSLILLAILPNQGNRVIENNTVEVENVNTNKYSFTNKRIGFLDPNALLPYYPARAPGHA